MASFSFLNFLNLSFLVKLAKQQIKKELVFCPCEQCQQIESNNINSYDDHRVKLPPTSHHINNTTFPLLFWALQYWALTLGLSLGRLFTAETHARLQYQARLSSCLISVEQGFWNKFMSTSYWRPKEYFDSWFYKALYYCTHAHICNLFKVAILISLLGILSVPIHFFFTFSLVHSGRACY